ncbi:hypothetical protein TanjilG_05715 [Lupinus angustifolius]|uniref:Uncharacterized protein n=1 Tax=Lupinus angustifolius TaxID=3871 RepID=A0A4P1R392_LUPAN|nr:hypothetical protein TanjilG_05715 [Lupinus angustifolius]
MFLILYCFCYRTMQPKGKRGKAAEPKNNEQNTEGTSSNNTNNNRERKEKVVEVVEDSSHSASLNEQLEMICNIIIDLQEKKISETNEDHLQDIVLLLDDMKNKNVDVEWLHQRLVEILQAREVLKQTSMLKEKREFSRQKVENAEKELKEKERDRDGLAILLKVACAEVADCKEKLDATRNESARIDETIADSESKADCFLNCSLVDDLL